MEQNIFITFADKILSLIYNNILILNSKFEILYSKNSNIYKKNIDNINQLCNEQKMKLKTILKKMDLNKLVENKIYKFQIEINNIIYNYRIIKLNLNEKIFYLILNEIESINNGENFFDFLTGIYNRKGLEYAFNKLEKYKNIGIIILDISNFKLLNKTKGFKYGDTILKEISIKLMNLFLEEKAIIARIATDIFVVIADNILEKVHILLNELKKFNQQDIFFNIGIITNLELLYNESLNKKNFFEDIMYKLDITLENAKLNHRQVYSNSIEYYSLNLLKNTEKLLKTKKLVEEAIQNKRFIYYYQPIVNYKGEIIGIETLLRIKDKNGNIISPYFFINYLEETGLIKEVDLLLTDKLKEILEYIKINNLNINVSLNLSAATIEDKNVINKILKNYLDYKKILKIEITERLLIMQETLQNTLLNKFKIVIDDFGTGYSSLKYLAEMPAACLKLDISFVREMFNPNTNNYYLIIKTIINFAKELNLKVVAEGVEQIEQFYELKKMGCDYFQGYYFYKPMPFDNLKKLLENNQRKI